MLSNPGQVLDLLGSITRNQMLMNELKAKTAVGQAYQGALNPDMSLDPQKFRAGLASNPDAMWAAPEATSQAQSLINSQLQYQDKQRQIISTIFGALPAKPTNEQLYNAVTTAARMGIPPANLVPWLDGIVKSPNREQAFGIVRNMGLSPGEQSTRQEMIDPSTGARMTVPTAAANVMPSGALPTALSPDEQKSVEKFGQDKPYAGQYAQRALPLEQAMRAINDAQARSPGIFGPGSEGRQEFKAFWQTLTPGLAKWAGVDPKEIASYAEAKKYLVQSIQSRNQQLGGHSDQQLATTVSGNPNVQVTDLALPDLVRTALAAQRAEQSQMQEGFKAGGPRYTDALSKWPARNDVRAFALDLMPSDERDKFIKSLSPAERSRINSSLQSAYEGGIIDRPAKGAAAAPARAPTAVPATKTPASQVQLRRRADGSQGWFIQDPSQPGKHIEVTLPGLGQ